MNEFRCFSRGNLACIEPGEDFAALFRNVIGLLSADLESEFSDDGVQAASDGWIGDSKLAFHLFDIAPIPNEVFQKLEAFLREPAETAGFILTFNFGIAGVAM